MLRNFSRRLYTSNYSIESYEVLQFQEIKVNT